MSNETPPITDEMRSAAAQQRGGWLHVIDPLFAATDFVPPEGFVGAFEVTSDGEVGEYRANPGYSELAAACASFAPTNDLERALCEHALGHGSEDELMRLLLESTVVASVDQSSGDPVVFVIEDRPNECHIFTSSERVPDDGSGSAQFLGADLLDRLPDSTLLVINPNSVVSVSLG